ncbi:hypothetical protein BDM02DRAFT_3125901 [Thelephora ganbajun]|uniref:Uncharacterized protein n=1 Tax=Thelephora ganbajun TaxID=370292 RepID=A0ACB6ZUM1_THEGA|nr:hypothetical protein BDM02DRAFT_3125901 [Thelephora ganbajun]
MKSKRWEGRKREIVAGVLCSPRTFGSRPCVRATIQIINDEGYYLIVNYDLLGDTANDFCSLETQVLAVKTRVKHFPEDNQGSDRTMAPPKPCKVEADDSTSPGGRESLRRSMTREYGFEGDVKESTSTVKGERPSAQICKRDKQTFVCVGATSWK